LYSDFGALNPIYFSGGFPVDKSKPTLEIILNPSATGTIWTTTTTRINNNNNQQPRATATATPPALPPPRQSLYHDDVAALPKSMPNDIYCHCPTTRTIQDIVNFLRNLMMRSAHDTIA
jgi:hypothetical protein